MEVTKLSSKGQIIVPKLLRDIYHWQPGQEFVVMDTEEGILLKPKQVFEPTKLEDANNRPPYQGEPKTVEQMDSAIDSEIRKKWK